MATQCQDPCFVADFEARKQPYFSSKVLNMRSSVGMFHEPPPGNRTLRVLVADDCRDACDSMAMLVQLWGHNVRQARDGVAALELALAFEPDVLLLDIAMPLLDGYQVARHLRQVPSFKDSLVVAFTGYGDDGHRLLWEGAFDHYLIKPVDPTLVESILLRAGSRVGYRSDKVGIRPPA